MKVATILLTAGTAMLALAPIQAVAQSNCLRQSYIESWDLAGPNALLVRQGQHEWYRVSLVGGCTGLTHSVQIGFQSKSHMLCMDVGDRVIIRHGVVMADCMVSKIEPYTGPNPDTAKAAPTKTQAPY